MPANLTPQYSRAEEEYRRAQTAAEQVECLERMLQLLPKHKGTEKIQADLKTRLKETRAEVQAEKSAPKKGKVFRFPRQGAGQIVLLGAPNAGKSRVLKELTHARPEVAPYPFTTREPMPGMMDWEDVAVQLIDTPPVTDHQFDAYLPNIVRCTDACLLCFDGGNDDAPDQTAAVIRQFADRKTLLARESGFVEDDFSRVRIKTLLVITHGDDPDADVRLDMFRELGDFDLETIKVELDRPDSVSELRNRAYGLLNVIRVYTKAPGKPADYTSPFTLPQSATVEDLAARIHKELADQVKYAKIWGSGAFDGQSVGRDHVLADRDLVELHT
jgi:ribosome-interacting GTPase 1